MKYEYTIYMVDENLKDIIFFSKKYNIPPENIEIGLEYSYGEDTDVVMRVKTNVKIEGKYPIFLHNLL